VSEPLTSAALAYARALVKRWKQTEMHKDCVHPGRVVRMADIVLPDGTFGQRPYSVATGEWEHNKHCGMANIIPSGFCEHGNYVGDSSGPDYICGLCEEGDDRSLMERAFHQARMRQEKITRDLMAEVHKAMLEKLKDLHKTNSAAFGWVSPDSIVRMVSNMSELVDA
jgi:hypothetical protein